MHIIYTSAGGARTSLGLLKGSFLFEEAFLGFWRAEAHHPLSARDPSQGRGSEPPRAPTQHDPSGNSALPMDSVRPSLRRSGDVTPGICHGCCKASNSLIPQINLAEVI